jgi:hypothetical protein
MQLRSGVDESMRGLWRAWAAEGGASVEVARRIALTCPQGAGMLDGAGPAWQARGLTRTARFGGTTVNHDTSTEGRDDYDALAIAFSAQGLAVAGRMFGMPILKAGGKAFAGYAAGSMTFKLAEPERSRALGIDGATLFDPMGGRPMREWVQVPAAAASAWPELAEAARAYVAG